MAAPAGDAPLTAANNIQPFFVLHKAAAAAASSVPSSRARRRIDASLPSSPNPKSAKRPRDVDAQDEEDSELYEQLRLEAFHRIWSRIQSTIDEVLRGINLKLFDQVLQWAQESFSAIRAVAKPCHEEVRQPYPLLTDVICRRIPTAFILTKNAEFVDDITTFRDLAAHLQSSGCHLAKLSAAELSVKHGVGGCFRSLLRQLLSDVPDVADVSALASWYCEAENYDQPIIVIIDDLEQCSGDVLGELVMMLSEWVIKIPIFFVVGIATTLDAPKKLLSSEALQQLEPCKLTLGSPSDRMNALVEAILVKPCAGFCISHEVAMFLRNYFFRHDGTITSFISALKLACSKHFSMEPLSFLCMGVLEEDCEEFWHDKFEALPQVMQKYAFALPSCTSATNSSNSRNDMVKGLSKLLKLQKDWSSVLLCLYEAGRHDKVQLLDIFCEAVNPDLPVSKVNIEKLSGMKSGFGKVYMAQVMNAIRYLPMETLLNVLEVWSIHLRGISELIEQDNSLQQVRDQAAKQEHGWSMVDKLLLKEGKIFVPAAYSVVPSLLDLAHGMGHEGIQKTLHRLRADFHVPGDRRLVLEFIRNCEVCQRNKTEHLRPGGLLQPLEIPSTVWSDIAMDFIEALPRVNGKTVILTVVDRFSKFAHFIPLSHPYTAASVAKVFFQEIVRLHGIPVSIVSDRDPVFTSTFWKELFALTGVKLHFTSAFHPQSDGQSEATNKIIAMYLRCLTGDRPRQWIRWLPWAEFCYNSSFQASLKTSPFKVVYGREPPVLRSYEQGEARLPAVEQQLMERDEFLAEIKDRLEQAQQYSKQQYDKKHRELSFEVGQWVWLRLLHRPMASLNVQGRGKLGPKYFGPYKIAEKIGEVAYRLDLPLRARLHNVFHVGLLKPFHGIPPDAPPALPPVQNGRVCPQPAKVLKGRLARGRYEVLVQWMNKEASSAEWVSLQEFKRLYPDFQLEDELLLQGGRDVMTGQVYQRRGKMKETQQIATSG